MRLPHGPDNPISAYFYAPSQFRPTFLKSGNHIRLRDLVWTQQMLAWAVSTTVPSGVTTGQVQVATSTGTLSSNVSFRVLP